MTSCDALIVGGGPAGLAAAIALRQQGADVLVADALQPPIDKPCGEGLMPEALTALTRLGVQLDPHHGAQLDSRHGAAFRGIAFVSDSARVSADFPVGTGFGIRRTALHQILVDRASALGVRFAWKTPVVLSDSVTLAGAPCRYRWLIGADGHASRVRSWAGLDLGQLRSRRFGFRAHFRLAPWSDHVEVHWGSLGQAYITPIGPEEICVSAMTGNSHLRLDGILASIPSLVGKFTRLESTSLERGCLTLTRRLHRVIRGPVCYGPVALIGDASGSVDAVTGEGLALAFRQASLLAESLETGRLDLYQQQHSDLLALPHRMSALLLLLDRMPRLRRRAMAVFAARPSLFQEFLAVHVGDQPLRHFLLRHGPDLGARLLSTRNAA